MVMENKLKLKKDTEMSEESAKLYKNKKCIE